MANKQQYFEGVFKDSTLSQAPNQLYTFVEGQDNYFLQKILGIIATIISSDIELLRDNIFPASANSTYLDKHLASANLPIRSGATVSFGTMAFVIPLTTSYLLANPLTLTLGTTLSNDTSGNVYLIQGNLTIPASTQSNPVDIRNITFDFISQQVGSSTFSNAGTPNTFAIPISLTVVGLTTLTITSATILSITSGIDGQTDYDISDIINRNSRSPKGSGSIGDFYNWALQSSPNILDAIIISNGFINNNLNTWIYIAILSGSKDPNININLAYPINRGVNSTTIKTCNQYIETKRGILDNINVINVSTYLIQFFDNLTPDTSNTPSPLTPLGIIIALNINLSIGLDSTTQITGTNGITQSVDTWVRQQFRYAVLSAPYQGESIDSSTDVYIKNDTIITLLKSRLGNDSISTGVLASIIEYASFTYTDVVRSTPILNIPVPNFSNLFIPANTIPNNPLSSIAGIYDIDITTATLSINYQVS